MGQKFRDILYNIAVQLKWKHIICAVLLMFGITWAGMYHFEPKGALISSPEVFWWYFLATASSAGYAGYLPATTGGKIFGSLIILGGGVIFAAMFAKGISFLLDFLQRKKKGKVKLKMNDHLVILGYKETETELLVAELLADGLQCPRIVLCSRLIQENPMPGKVEFVMGDNTLDDTLDRACIGSANRIVIYGHTDDRTLAVAIAANFKARPEAHIVAYLERADNARHLNRLNPKIRCVTSMRVFLLAQELLNPGAAAVIKNIVSPTDPGTHYRLEIPDDVPSLRFEEVFAIFKGAYEAIVIAVGDTHERNCTVTLNPPCDSPVSGGMSLFYIAHHRVDEAVNWSEFVPAEKLLDAVHC